MAEERQTALVSRSEFYRALNLVSLYIMLLAMFQLRGQATWPQYLLFGAALGMSLWMTVQVFRLRAGNKGGT
jgi:hypothetical protein